MHVPRRCEPMEGVTDTPTPGMLAAGLHAADTVFRRQCGARTMREVDLAESTSRGMELDVSTALLALVALAASYRDDLTTTPDDRRKTEVILSDVGLTLGQIAQVTGRKY